MNTMFYQIMITVWVHGHALTYTLPAMYAATDFDVCMERAGQIYSHRKRNARVMITCETTDQRKT